MRVPVPVAIIDDPDRAGNRALFVVESKAAAERVAASLGLSVRAYGVADTSFPIGETDDPFGGLRSGWVVTKDRGFIALHRREDLEAVPLLLPLCAVAGSTEAGPCLVVLLEEERSLLAPAVDDARALAVLWRVWDQMTGGRLPLDARDNAAATGEILRVDPSLRSAYEAWLSAEPGDPVAPDWLF